MVSCQLAVIGAGSAGCGAALAASRLGIDTILVENYQRIGGTSTFAGVNCYEPVAGATGISRRIFQEMQRNDSAGVGIYRITRHCMIPDEAAHPFPGSEQRIDPAGRYEDTLRSHMEEQEFSRALRLRRGIIFEPELFCRTVEGLLAQSGCCRLRTGVAPAAVECRDGVLRRMVLTDGTRLEAARSGRGTMRLPDAFRTGSFRPVRGIRRAEVSGAGAERRIANLPHPAGGR